MYVLKYIFESIRVNIEILPSFAVERGGGTIFWDTLYIGVCFLAHDIQELPEANLALEDIKLPQLCLLIINPAQPRCNNPLI